LRVIKEMNGTEDVFSTIFVQNIFCCDNSY